MFRHPRPPPPKPRLLPTPIPSPHPAPAFAYPGIPDPAQNPAPRPVIAPIPIGPVLSLPGMIITSFFSYSLIITAPHLGHFFCVQGMPASCGSLCPHCEHTQEPPGPAAPGPPILPPPCPPSPLPWPRPDPFPLGIIPPPSLCNEKPYFHPDSFAVSLTLETWGFSCSGAPFLFLDKEPFPGQADSEEKEIMPRRHCLLSRE